MKSKPLALFWLLLSGPALAQVPSGEVASSVPASPPTTTKFDWNLNLTVGQKWTQTTTVESSSTTGGADFGIHMRFALHNEVLFADGNEYVVQCTFGQFDQSTRIARIDDGKNVVHQPDRSKFTRGFLGVPFKVKLTRKGKITAVSGLEKLVDGGWNSINALAKSEAEKKELLSFLRDADSLRSIVVRYSEMPLPARPLEVGQNYKDVFEAYPSFDSMEKVTVAHTLRAFGGNTALFSDDGTIKTYTNQPAFRRFGSDKEPIYEASRGSVLGEMSVDCSTGLSQHTQKFEANIKTTVILANGKRDTRTTNKQIQVATSMKIDS